MAKTGRSQSARGGASGLQRPAAERLAAMATFAKVVDLNGFSAAARDMGISKSAAENPFSAPYLHLDQGS